MAQTIAACMWPAWRRQLVDAASAATDTGTTGLLAAGIAVEVVVTHIVLTSTTECVALWLSGPVAVLLLRPIDEYRYALCT